jgi:hypothetical protein
MAGIPINPGDVYGKLTVIERGPDKIRKSGKVATWVCRCECGRTITLESCKVRLNKACEECRMTQRRKAPRQPRLLAGTPTDDCLQCQYHSRNKGTCDYILLTKRRRPCKAGKGCTVGVAGPYMRTSPYGKQDHRPEVLEAWDKAAVKGTVTLNDIIARYVGGVR